MAFYSVAAYRSILAEETDDGSPVTEELMTQYRENIEALVMMLFYRGYTGSATSNPPNDTTGVLTDTAASYDNDELIGLQLLIQDGNAKGNLYTIDDNTGTTITCTGDNLYSDGVRSGDAYRILYDITHNGAHDHDGENSALISASAGQGALPCIDNSTGLEYTGGGGINTSFVWRLYVPKTASTLSGRAYAASDTAAADWIFKLGSNTDTVNIGTTLSWNNISISAGSYQNTWQDFRWEWPTGSNHNLRGLSLAWN